MAPYDATLEPVADTSEPVTLSATGTLATVGAFTGLAGVVASSCCVIPLALGSLGVGAGAVGALEALVPWRMTLLTVSGLAVAGAWALWWRKSQAACASASCAAPRRSRFTLAALAVATKVVLVAAAWPFLEPILLKLVRAA